MSKDFRKDGLYTVQMGLLGKNDTSRTTKECYMKKIRIHNSCEEYEIIKSSPEIADEPALTGLPLKVLFMNDISERQKNRIKPALKILPPEVSFLSSGILPDSSHVLDIFVDILKANPELRMDVVVHSSAEKPSDGKMDMSERRAQEISMYLENHETGDGSFSCRGTGSSGSVLKPLTAEETKTGLIEFIFMEKNPKR
jgi:outer membrane protein OmpA-like peptidoglycan-associated protein